MNNQELNNKLSALFPSIIFEENQEWLTLIIEAKDLLAIAMALRSAEDLAFDYLFCLTCIDWKNGLTMVYHLTSTKFRHSIIIKSKLDRNEPQIETLSAIWRTAEFHEREVYDLFGVIFLHHPDMRRLFMTDEWKGWPLRKDYEDPVNMIKL
jgi:NADH-quinone oxidoreductase subunit C